jgi:hypothetical protein
MLSSPKHFNMSAAVWRQLRSRWQLPLTRRVLLQSYVAGPLFSALHSTQTALTRSRRSQTSLAGSVFVLGYWRSGTTLLHNYLCCDKRFGYPSTYACMQPHHFVLTQAAALAQGQQRSIARPMDDVRISAATPQEDEFALLALGARSPYEALLTPRHLAEALGLSDPRDLTPTEQARWREVFVEFLSGVSVVEGGRPLVLKSPPHGYRAATLREIVPDARFIVIVRSPATVFESAVNMWHSLFPMYALESIPPEDHTRQVVLQDRLRFEAKLAAGLEGLPDRRVAYARYEDLVRDPLGTLGRVYEQLRLEDYSTVEPALRAEARTHERYVARNASPRESWMTQLRTAWAPVFERYGYP